MKTLLVLFCTIGTISGSSANVISCNVKQNDSLDKKNLAKIINKVEVIVKDAIEGDYEVPQITILKNELSKAKKVYADSKSKNRDYRVAKFNLNSEMKEFEEPGYKTVRKDLLSLIDSVRKVIKKNFMNDEANAKVEILNKLYEALVKAQEIVNQEDSGTILLFKIKQELSIWYYEYISNKVN